MTPTTKAKTEQPPVEQKDELTLRDQFALQAVVGCLCVGRHFEKAALAGEAYEMADAMLIARKKEPK